MQVVGYATDPKVPAVEQLETCLTGCNLVLIPAGVPWFTFSEFSELVLMFFFKSVCSICQH